MLLGVYVSWLGRIVIFFIAVLGAVAAFMARSLAVGDEDEFRAWLKREKGAAQPGVEEEVRLDPKYWLSRPDRHFDDAPPPPTVEDLKGPNDGGET